MAALRRLFWLHEQSERNGVPVEELAGLRAERRTRELLDRSTRRQFLAAGASVAAGSMLAGSRTAAIARALDKRSAPRVAIVGAGLAGLRCAHLLFTSNAARPVLSTVYEANPERAGGRCWTLRDFFADGLLTEHGGSFLNSNQTAVRRLAALLGL